MVDGTDDGQIDLGNVVLGNEEEQEELGLTIGISGPGLNPEGPGDIDDNGVEEVTV